MDLWNVAAGVDMGSAIVLVLGINHPPFYARTAGLDKREC